MRTDTARSRVKLRVAQSSDAARVFAFLRQEARHLKRRSEAAWKWLFEDNPVHRRLDPSPPHGWVLEDGDDICGYLGNIRLDYTLDGELLSVASATSYCVRPSARAESVRLMRAFLQQKDVDLFLADAANDHSGRVYRLFKAETPKDDSFLERFIWVAHDGAAIADVLAAKGTPRLVATAIGKLGAPFSRAFRALSGFADAGSLRPDARIRKLSAADLGPQFDGLFERIRALPGLRPYRDAARLRWYFADPDVKTAPVIFAFTDGNEIAGYAAVARYFAGSETIGNLRRGEISQLRIVDLVVAPGHESAIEALIRAIVAHARDNGIGLVCAPPGGAELARELKLLSPHVHRRLHNTHFVRTANLADLPRFTAPGIWQATGLDGEGPL